MSKLTTVACTIGVTVAAVSVVQAQGGWEPVVGANGSTPAGFGDSVNRSVMASAVNGPYLYLGTLNDDTGSEVWRSSDGIAWARVNLDGYGGADPDHNVVTYSMASFGDEFYSATWTWGAAGSPPADTKVWRFDGGDNWTQVNSDGFGDSANAGPWAMIEFKGDLYVSASNYEKGAEVWRTNIGTSWTNVSDAGFGNGNNVEIMSMAVHDSYLFAGTLNFDEGAEIWRSDDGTNWTLVADSGDLGGSNHQGAYSMVSFDGQLFVSTYNTDFGGRVYRTSDGTSWSLLAPSDNGFGDFNNYGAFAATVYEGGLYFGLFNWLTGTEIWYSPDGDAWMQINADGFGDDNNYGVFAFSEFNGLLYAGIRNHTGCQVWRYSAAVFTDGFESSDTSAWSIVIP